MYLFRQTPRFNVKTGKPNGFETEQIGIICDFCGKVLPQGDDAYEEEAYGHELGITISQDGGSEESYYYLDYPPGIDMHDLWSTHDKFYYCASYAAYASPSCSLQMIEKYMKDMTLTHISDIFYIARLEMLKQVLLKGYSLSDFDLGD